MNEFLTHDERTTLIMQHRQERDRRIADRIKTILLADDGMLYVDIARVLFLDDQSISRFVLEYKDRQKLKPENGGSVSKLTEEQTALLCEHLGETLYTKTKDICGYVFETFGVSYTVAGLTHWLHDHDFSYKKPKGIPAKADPVKQAIFCKAYEDFMNSTPDNEPIVFMDGVHPTMTTKLSYGWIKKGQDHEIPTTGNRTRLNILGAINLQLMQTTTSHFETINGQAVISFLTKLMEVYPHAPKIHAFADNGGYFTCKEVHEFCKKNRIQLHFLPPYSPNLNPIERLWKVFHEYVSNNRYYKTARDFKDSVFEFFSKTLPNIAQSLTDRINDNFRIVNTVSSI